MNIFIEYLAGCAGSGKTQKLLHYVQTKISSGHKVLWLSPTKELSTATRARLLATAAGTPTSIVQGDGAVKKILRLLNHPEHPEGHILFATWSAFELLPPIPAQEGWTLIVDEVPQVYVEFNKSLPVSHHIITQHLQTGPVEGPYRYAPIFPCEGKKSAVEKLAQNGAKDDMHEILRPLAQRLIPKKWKTYVDIDSYEKLISSGEGEKRLIAFSVLDPSIFARFKSVVM